MKIGLDVLKNMSILYAEDDPTIREASLKTLSIFFKTIISVDNGRDAIDTYKKMKPNIVMLDIRMPIINGLEVASAIRHTDQFTPIIVTTAYQETEDFLRAIKLNLADYLIKPFSFEQLMISLLESIKRLHQNGLIYKQINDGLHYDFTTKTIIKDNRTITLTKSEMIVFEQLVIHKASLVTYREFEEILGLEFYESKASIKNTVLRLRKKIGKEIIVNIQDLGYSIV